MNRRVAVLVVALALAFGACSPGATVSPATSGPASSSSQAATSSGSATATGLTIYGAASLKGALLSIKTSYETSHPGTTLTITTDSSAALRTQIEQGAPADVFLSADTTNPKKLVDEGLADGAPVDFAGNLLTVVVPTANPAKIGTPADLAKPGVKVIAAGDDVPITKYALQAVGLLGGFPGYPANFSKAYAANVVSKEDNVKALIAKIELGEGDVGIVYVTDAKASTKVRAIDIPPMANIPATYGGVVVKASKVVAEAHLFLDWMKGPEAQTILGQLGFLPPQT